MRIEHAALVEQRELALGLLHSLQDEHHVGPAGVVFVKHQGDAALQRPRQDALAELGDLLAVTQRDDILADQVNAADMAVEVDAHTGPVEARGHLVDVAGLAGAMVALDHDAAVVHEAREDRERGVAIEAVGRIDGPARDRCAR